MSQIGIINIIRTTAPPEGGGGSGLLGGLAALLGVGMLGVAGYRALDAALRGVAASSAEANRVAGWAFAVVLVVAALTAAVWVLLARRRALRDAPIIEAFTAATDRALTDRALAARRRAALDPAPGAPPTAQQQATRQVTATRLDRVESGQVWP